MRLAVAASVFFLALVSCGYAQAVDYNIESSAWGDVYFDTRSAELSPEARKTLDGLYSLVEDSPGSVVMLAGYDDQRTPAPESIALGWKRVGAVKDYLVSLGADPETVKNISFGNTKVAVPGTGEEVWSKNRRVRYRVAPPTDPDKTEGMPASVCQKCKR